MSTKSVVPFPRDLSPALQRRIAAWNDKNRSRHLAPTSSAVDFRHTSALRSVPAGPDARWPEAFAGVSPIWTCGKRVKKAFEATIRAFAEIADDPHNLELTIVHYRVLRDLGFNAIEGAYLIASAAGVPGDADIEDHIHSLAPALIELASCPIKPDPYVARYWSAVLSSFGLSECTADPDTSPTNNSQGPK